LARDTVHAAIVELHSDLRFVLAELSAAAAALILAIYTFTGASPAPIVELFVVAAPLIFVILWLHRDAHRTGVGAVADLGYFLLLAWPVVIPWYVLKTRGRFGWLLLFVLFAMIGAASISALLAGYAIGHL